MDKPHQTFRKIIQYCKMMNYNVNDILDMTDHELRLWYHHVIDMMSNNTDFKIRTGMTITDGKNGGKKYPWTPRKDI